MADQNYWITAEQLRVGVYVHLDLGWMDHPFSFNNFKIKSEDQIRTIRGLGLKKLRWDPAKSDAKPMPAAPAGAADAAASSPPPPAEAPLEKASLAAKQQRAERLRAHREQLAKVQQAFVAAAATVRSINRGIFSQPQQTIEQSQQLVRAMVDTFLAAPEIAIQVMGDKPGSEEAYFHTLNVSVLAMMLGRELGLGAGEMNLLGVGCLFHDIGLSEVPGKILLKTEALTRAEREFREQHCRYGVDIAQRVGLAPAVQNIIMQHHEFQDGSGYPKGLKGEAVDLLSRVVVIANHYDNLCNPVNLAAALTPHEALSLMFAQQRAKFDPKILQIFIRCLGVFPPGTVVRLSNDVVGLVISINAARPLKPDVIIYDAKVPRHEAIIVDLDAEPDVSISQAIRPSQLPRAIFDYLSPKKRISYYFDADAGKPAAAS